MSGEEVRADITKQTVKPEPKVVSKAAIAVLAIGGVLTLVWLGLLGWLAIYLIHESV